MRALIAGNWKMHGLQSQLGEIQAIADIARDRPPYADILICPPPTLIARAVEVAADFVTIGGQDCHAEISGPFTGDVSAEMLKDAGASAVIVGHSERRQYHGETDTVVAAKARAAWRAGLLAIICIGETDAQRRDGKALSVCTDQISGSVPRGTDAFAAAIAYEQQWAIGTGRAPPSRDGLVGFRAPEHERPGVAGIMEQGEDRAVQQRPPGEFVMMRPAVRAVREAEALGMEGADRGARRPRPLEGGEDQPDGPLHLLVGIEDDLPIFAVAQADGQGEAEGAVARFVEDAPAQAGAQHMEFRLRHGAF